VAVPNRKAEIERVLARFAAHLVQPAELVDAFGRSLLPHCIQEMPAEERDKWGVLKKSTGTFPYDVLVWGPTREHVDVFTSRAVSGDEKNDKTGPRRLMATWTNHGLLPRPDWTWCRWQDSTIVPFGNVVPVTPDPEPAPVNHAARLREAMALLDIEIQHLNDIRDRFK
jgi:hypothetical protein